MRYVPAEADGGDRRRHCSMLNIFPRKRRAKRGKCSGGSVLFKCGNRHDRSAFFECGKYSDRSVLFKCGKRTGNSVFFKRGNRPGSAILFKCVVRFMRFVGVRRCLRICFFILRVRLAWGRCLRRMRRKSRRAHV